MELRIAGAQIPVTNDIATNLATLGRAMEFAASEGAEILLTPEGSLSGYRPDFDVAEVKQALAEVTGRAKALGLGLALGTCFREPQDGACYNQIRFYTPAGEFLGFHSKTLTCGSWDDPPRGEINDYKTAPLRLFDWHGLSLGGLICNDLWANPTCTPQPDPHLTQQLAQRGAKVIFHAVNGGRSGEELSRVAWHYHESNLRLRALAGGLWIVTVDNCHPTTLPCSAPSGIVAPNGTWAVQAPAQGAYCFVATLSLEPAGQAGNVSVRRV